MIGKWSDATVPPCVDVSLGHALVAGTLAGGRHGGRFAPEGV